MSAKRKDRRGRILKTGESQRKDETYMYRYNDTQGKRKYIYAKTLDELREKEKLIQKDLDDGIDYSGGNITVIELVEKYISQKNGVRYNTKVGYNFVLNILKKESFGHRKINGVKISDAKTWFIKMTNEGRGYSTITSIRGIVKPAFQMAVQDDIIRKNPFDFKLDIIPNTTKKREAISEEIEKKYLDFIISDNHYQRYYDEIMILLETGMRISEFVGLTLSDIDFKDKSIKVDHQLSRTRNGVYYIEKTKTSSGVREIPMTKTVYQCLQRIVANRKNPKIEYMVDGYSHFLLLDKDGKPKVALHIEKMMQRSVEKYNLMHEDKLPSITPHVLRHTFCTRMATGGMNPKVLQYIMGHSDISMTLNVYTHANFENAVKEFEKMNFVS